MAHPLPLGSQWVWAHPLNTSSHAGRHGVVLGLEAVHVLAQLPVDVLGQDPDVGEEGPQHRQLLLEQLHLLLQPLVLPGQDLDALLGLAGAESGKKQGGKCGIIGMCPIWVLLLFSGNIM